MKSAFRRTILIILPTIFFIVSLLIINIQSSVVGKSNLVDSYPPPQPTPTMTVFLNNIYNLYLPVIRHPWQYTQITPPPYSISVYINSFDNNALYNAGCEQGTKDKNLGGAQNSVVFLHFGLPSYQGEYGVRLHDSYEFKTTTDIANATIAYAEGYWLCVGYDTQSTVDIAIGTSNFYTGEVTYEHGGAWANMVKNANGILQQTPYKSQVGVAGANNMELGFNSPQETRNWVDGYNDSAFDPVYGYLFPLYNIGDAAGCPPYYGDCGTDQFPEWTQDDVWYISYGCDSCYVTPMIYDNGWANAEQWQNISKYSVVTHGFKVVFSGATTQYTACTQRFDPNCPYLDNTPEEGYNQLYTVLNSDPETAQGMSTLLWSTDMKWWGE